MSQGWDWIRASGVTGLVEKQPNQPSLSLRHMNNEHVLMSFPKRFPLIGLFLRFSLITALSCILPSPGWHRVLSWKTVFYHSQIMLSCFLYTQNSPYLPSKIIVSELDNITIFTFHSWWPQKMIYRVFFKSDIFQAGQTSIFWKTIPFHILRSLHRTVLFMCSCRLWAGELIGYNLYMLATETWVKASK